MKEKIGELMSKLLRAKSANSLFGSFNDDVITVNKELQFTSFILSRCGVKYDKGIVKFILITDSLSKNSITKENDDKKDDDDDEHNEEI